MRPNECIWCGLELLDDTTHDTIFACGTVQHPRSDCWSQSTGCEEIMRSRERIKRAVEVLEGAERCNGGWLDVIEVDQAIAILKGV